MIIPLSHYHTTVEVARMIGVSEATIRLAIKENKLDAYQLKTKQFLVEDKAVKAYLNKRELKKPLTNNG